MQFNKKVLSTSVFAALVFFTMGCSKSPNYTAASTDSNLSTGVIGGVPVATATPFPSGATIVNATPTPVIATPINLGNNLGFSNNGSPIVPVTPPAGSNVSGTAYFQVTAGQTVSLNLGVNQFSSSTTSGAAIPAGSSYQVVVPTGAGVTVVSSINSSQTTTCLPPQGILQNGYGTVCLLFTHSTAPTSPIPVVVNVTSPGATQVTANLYVSVQDALTPQIPLLRTCGRVARATSATVQSSAIQLTFEVILPNAAPMLLLSTALNSNLYNQAGILQPTALNLDVASTYPNYESLPVQINACSGLPGVSCAAVCNNPATIRYCVSRGTTSLAVQSNQYQYIPVTVALGSLLHPSTTSALPPVFLLSDHAAPSGVSAGSVVTNSQYCNLVSPLALTFHTGFPKTNMTTNLNPIFFDINADGKPQAMDFLNDTQAAFLVLPDEKGNISSGAQLFGPASIDLATGKPGKFENGFFALEQYVPKGAKSITQSDPIWSKLRLWFANGSSTVKPGSLFTLDEMKVVELSLMDHESSKTNDAGTAFKQISRFKYIGDNGRIVTDKFVDIWFTSY